MVSYTSFLRQCRRSSTMFSNNLILNEHDEKVLASLVEHNTQSVMIVAHTGSGKETIATELSAMIAKRPENTLKILPEEGIISIDQIRKVKQFLELKTYDSSQSRVVLLVNADKMTVEAQNSLLKILEEPPERCMLILTASNDSTMLPTISSRTRIIRLKNPTKLQIQEYLLKKDYELTKIQDVLKLSGNLVGLAIDILEGQNTDFVKSIELAKDFLAQTTLERLKIVDKISKSRDSTNLFLASLKTIATAMISAKKEGSERWVKILHMTNQAESKMLKNTNTKLVLDNLILSM